MDYAIQYMMPTPYVLSVDDIFMIVISNFGPQFTAINLDQYIYIYVERERETFFSVMASLEFRLFRAQPYLALQDVGGGGCL